MAKQFTRNHWVTLRNQSLAGYMSSAGFDIARYKDYPREVQKSAKKAAISEAVFEIKYTFEEEHNVDLSDLKKGVYVISLSPPLALRYQSGLASNVIYIGRGNMIGRIKSHFENSLFDLMNSLSGANFDLHFAVPDEAIGEKYFYHVEYLMLEHFAGRFGRLQEQRQLPLLNKNRGSKQSNMPTDTWWKKPLRSPGKRTLWELTPSKFSDFRTLER